MDAGRIVPNNDKFLLLTNDQSPSGKWTLFGDDQGKVVGSFNDPDEMRELLCHLGLEWIAMDVDGNGTIRQVPVEWIGDGEKLIGSDRAFWTSRSSHGWASNDYAAWLRLCRPLGVPRRPTVSMRVLPELVPCDGWLITQVTDRLILKSPTATGNQTDDARVEVYTRSETGEWHRTYVEVGDSSPHISTERVLSPHHPAEQRERNGLPIESDRELTLVDRISLLDWNNDSPIGYLWICGVGCPAGMDFHHNTEDEEEYCDFSEMVNDSAFVNLNKLWHLVGTVDVDGTWCWDGNGSVSDYRGNAILNVKARR